MEQVAGVDRQRLTALAEQHRAGYATARPFPHAVLDGLFPDALLDEVLAEFPDPDAPWWEFDSVLERKQASRDLAMMGPVTRSLLTDLNSAAAIDFLTSLTGIHGLVPDPHFFGGGLHQIEPGGFLKVHADFTMHPVTSLQRRLNLIVYLNRDWSEEYGGALELWDSTMSACGARVLPLFNRTVIFSTDRTSYHGHPDPLRCPPGRRRRSLALYYYSAPAAGDPEPRSFANTAFRARPGEVLAASSPSTVAVGTARRGRAVLSRWVPPALWDVARRVRGRTGPTP
jgi:hypothetical protein